MINTLDKLNNDENKSLWWEIMMKYEDETQSKDTVPMNLTIARIVKENTNFEMDSVQRKSRSYVQI